MMRAGPRAGPGNSGFTLLELMASLVLVSLLSLVAYAALNLSLKATRHAQDKVEALQELRVGTRYLERTLSSAVPKALYTKNRLYFDGEPQAIKFLTTVSLEAHNLGGLYHMRVFVGRDASGQGCLALEQSKIVNWRQDREGVEVRQILINNIEGLRFTYGLGSKEYSTWNGLRDGRLPDRVLMHLALPCQETRTWQIPIHVAEFQSKPE